MNKIIVEYLVKFDSKSSICKSQEALRNLIKVIENVTFENKSKIKYKTIYINCNIKSLRVDDSKYYNIQFAINDESSIDDLQEFLRLFRTLIKQLSNNGIQVLWDDISFYYSKAAYSHIYLLENNLRKLITKFMICKAGDGWETDSIPTQMTNTGKSKKNDNDSNRLYTFDFIQLSDFLFKQYSSKKIEDLKKITTSPPIEIEELLSQIAQYIPKTNWERYFQDLVDCDGDKLIKNWEKLYDLRCKIAHNNNFQKNDYNELVKLYNDLMPVFEKAIDKIDDIHITKEQIIELSENYQVYKNTNYRYPSIDTSVISNAFLTLSKNFEMYNTKAYIENILKSFSILQKSLGEYRITNEIVTEDKFNKAEPNENEGNSSDSIEYQNVVKEDYEFKNEEE